MASKQRRTPQRRSPLRTAAEIALAASTTPGAPLLTHEEVLHELRVHEIELEMQNEELRRSQLALEESRDRYLDLYEFAPVGYLTLTTRGLISEVNLTGAALLGRERSKLLQRPLSRFVAAVDGDHFHRHLAPLLQDEQMQSFSVRLRRDDNSVFYVQLNCVRVVREDTPTVLRITLIDINQMKQAEILVENLAFYDPLTQLPNRRLLMDRLRQALAASSRSLRYGAILFLDLDDFKTLNDTLGHDVGDSFLKTVSARLLAGVRNCDIVSRLGGDEFVVLLQDLGENRFEAVGQAKAVAEKILGLLKAPYELAGHDYRSSGTMGISLYSGGQVSTEDLLKQADLALYRAKAVCRGTLQFYDPEMQRTMVARALLENDLRRGLESQQFLLHYQPQVDNHGNLTGAEALVRWEHPERGLLLPENFILFLEEKGLIAMLGQWALESACFQLVQWSGEPKKSHLTLSVNVSAAEFCHKEFVPRTLAIIQKTRVDPTRLILEITESVTIGYVEEALAKIRTLKACGLKFAIDDFGIGYSSINYLKYLPLDFLKIDRSFVRDVLKTSTDKAIAEVIVSLGQSLGLLITVEGIETVAQRDFFASLGCQYFQGFLFGIARPEKELIPADNDAAVYIAN